MAFRNRVNSRCTVGVDQGRNNRPLAVVIINDLVGPQAAVW